MANLPLAFAELLVGAILIDAGIKGASPVDVVKGIAVQQPFSTTTSTTADGASTGGTPTAGTTTVGGGTTGLPQGTVGGSSASFPAGSSLTNGNVGLNLAGVNLSSISEGTDTSQYPVGVSTVSAPWNPSGKPIADWIIPILQDAYSAGVRFTVSSGYRTDAEQTSIYNSGTRPAAVPISEGGSGSNHEGDAWPAGAVDVATGQEALSTWLLKSPFAGILEYAGSKDPVHFSEPHDGGY